MTEEEMKQEAIRYLKSHYDEDTVRMDVLKTVWRMGTGCCTWIAR